MTLVASVKAKDGQYEAVPGTWEIGCDVVTPWQPEEPISPPPEFTPLELPGPSAVFLSPAAEASRVTHVQSRLLIFHSLLQPSNISTLNSQPNQHTPVIDNCERESHKNPSHP